MRRVIGLVLGLLTAGAVQAEPIRGNDARKQLFSPKGVTVMIVPGALDPRQTVLMETILKGIQENELSNYYGAIAVSPRFFEMILNDPLPAAQSGLLQLVERRHSVRMAETVALDACRAAAQAAGAAPCVVAARILPKRYKERGFTMSVAATAAFKDYRKLRGDKAFALSNRGRGFGFGQGTGAANEAIAACHNRIEAGAPKDCRIVIVD